MTQYDIKIPIEASRRELFFDRNTILGSSNVAANPTNQFVPYNNNGTFENSFIRNKVSLSFMDQYAGVGISNTIGVGASIFATLHVSENSGFPPPSRSNYNITKFEWDMGGVVFPNVTTSSKGMIGAENGMVVYDTTLAKLQVYAAGSWVSLH